MPKKNPALVAIPTEHTVDAQARIDELRAMRLAIPHFVIPTLQRSTQELSVAASLPPEFIHLTAEAVRISTALVRGGGTEPSVIRDLMTYGEAYSPFADELEALAQFVRHSIAAARHKAGTEALTTYALARRLAKQPENADLAPHVADMRRALGKRFKGRKPDPVEPEPAPAPKKTAKKKT